MQISNQNAIQFGQVYRVQVPGKFNDELQRREAEVADRFVREKRAAGFDAEKELQSDSWFIYTDEGSDDAHWLHKNLKEATREREQALAQKQPDKAERRADRIERLTTKLEHLILHAVMIRE